MLVLVGVCWHIHLMFKVHLWNIQIARECVFSDIFQLWSPPPASREHLERIMLSVQMKLSTVMCLSDHGLKQWNGQWPDLEVWSSLRSFQLTQVHFAGASRFLHSTPGSARVSLRKPRGVYRLPFNLFFCEMRVVAVWLELSCIRECWGYTKGLVLVGMERTVLFEQGICHMFVIHVWCLSHLLD